MLTAKSTFTTLLLALGVVHANAQTYWSTDPNLDCSGYAHVDSQATGLPGQGLACLKEGDLPWYAAGQGWRTFIRVAAPPSAPIRVHVFFSPAVGSLILMNFSFSGDPAVYMDFSASRVLAANQSTEIAVFGLSPQDLVKGPMPVSIYCPDAKTCSQVEVQLIYSALPFRPWSFSVPVVWNDQFSYQWSAVGIDDGGTDQVSFAVSNHAPETRFMQRVYTLNVYDAAGKLYSSGVTQPLGGGENYGALLRDVVPNLPSGPFKMQLVGDALSAFEAFQFHADSATALAVASEKSVASATTNAATKR